MLLVVLALSVFTALFSFDVLLFPSSSPSPLPLSGSELTDHANPSCCFEYEPQDHDRKIKEKEKVTPLGVITGASTYRQPKTMTGMQYHNTQATVLQHDRLSLL